MTNTKDKWMVIEGFWLVEPHEESGNLFSQEFNSYLPF